MVEIETGGAEANVAVGAGIKMGVTEMGVAGGAGTGRRKSTDRTELRGRAAGERGVVMGSAWMLGVLGCK